MSSTEIKFNKEQVNHGIEELKQCQKELYEADKLFYKGIMALAAAKGIDLIINEDAGINLYMPEKIVIECREEITHLIEEINTKIGLIEGFNEEPKEAPEKIQHRETDYETGEGRNIQPLYGAPVRDIVTEPIEEVIDRPIQALYAAPGVVSPIEEPITSPVQPMYAPPSVIEPIEDPVISDPVQPLYAPPTMPEPDIPVVTQPEYETIPNTSTAGIVEKNYVSKHPKLIGGLASAFGLFGIPTIISDDLDELEEERINKKKD